MKPVDIAPTRKARRLAALVTAVGSVLIAGLSLGPLTASAANVPDCVETQLNDKGFIDHLEVTNKCDHPVRIKVVLAFETDKACEQLSPDQQRLYAWAYPGRFDKLVTC